MVDRRQETAIVQPIRGTRRAGTPVEVEDRRPVDMGPLEVSIGYHMRRAQVAIFHDIIKAFAEHDIRPAQYSVLVLIAANPGLNQSEIAAALGIKRTNFVALIDSLERRGLARREPTLSDRRSYALYLTEAGVGLLGQLQALQAEHEARVIQRIGADKRDDLLALLTSIAALAGDDVVEE